jgi:hypothetical protein
MSEPGKNMTLAQCECSRWGAYAEVGVGIDPYPTFDTFRDKFEIIKERNSWLVLARCKHCKQGWYVSIDVGDYDAIFFIRVTDTQIQDALSNDKWPDAVQVAVDNSSWMGDEIGPEICKIPGCKSKKVKFSVLCRLHHYESMFGFLWKPEIEG